MPPTSAAGPAGSASRRSDGGFAPRRPSRQCPPRRPRNCTQSWPSPLVPGARNYTLPLPVPLAHAPSPSRRGHLMHICILVQLSARRVEYPCRRGTPHGVILVTGTVGVGKTSVLLEIGEALARGGEPYAIVDLDWLAWLRPDRDQWSHGAAVLVENLGVVARPSAAAGVERLVARACRPAGGRGRRDPRGARRRASSWSRGSSPRPRSSRRGSGGATRATQLAEHLAEAARSPPRRERGRASSEARRDGTDLRRIASRGCAPSFGSRGWR